MEYLKFEGQPPNQVADYTCLNFQSKPNKSNYFNAQIKNECEFADNQSWTTDASIPLDLDYAYSQKKNSIFQSPLYSNEKSYNLFKATSFERSSESISQTTTLQSHSLSCSKSSIQQKQNYSIKEKKQIQQETGFSQINNKPQQSSYLAQQIEGIEYKQKGYNYITDRFIPSRKQSKLNTYSAYECNENFFEQQQFTRGQAVNNNISVKNAADKNEINQITVSKLYKNFVLGVKDKIMYNISLNSAHAFCPYKNENILRFKNPIVIKNFGNQRNVSLQQKSILQPSSSNNPNQMFMNLEEELCCSHLSYTRKISKVPFKVLDAPALQDDFYLNLIDWSNQNILAVGLSSGVYLWSACSSKVTKLCDFGRTNEITSVNWSPRSSLISIGTNTGEVEIWDTVKIKRVRVLKGHSQRVGTLAWNTNILTSGSRDKTILQRDLRAKNLYEQKLIGHKQEVCGLKWSFDEEQLASGGNDNKLCVWNLHSNKPIIKFINHNAAVKALTWTPHQHGLLVSGGGTQDRTIRFWNTLTSRQLECIETGSQVCNLIFSKNVNELISTHGYSQNQIIIWKYPEMQKIITLTGHSCRVLYLAMSPDGQTIVTGAGDETLRFWNAFPSNKEHFEDNEQSQLQYKNHFLR